MKYLGYFCMILRFVFLVNRAKVYLIEAYYIILYKQMKDQKAILARHHILTSVLFLFCCEIRFHDLIHAHFFKTFHCYLRLRQRNRNFQYNLIFQRQLNNSTICFNRVFNVKGLECF